LETQGKPFVRLMLPIGRLTWKPVTGDMWMTLKTLSSNPPTSLSGRLTHTLPLATRSGVDASVGSEILTQQIIGLMRSKYALAFFSDL